MKIYAYNIATTNVCNKPYKMYLCFHGNVCLPRTHFVLQGRDSRLKGQVGGNGSFLEMSFEEGGGLNSHINFVRPSVLKSQRKPPLNAGLNFCSKRCMLLQSHESFYPNKGHHPENFSMLDLKV